MTQLGLPKRQVLASLVPVKIRNDPLQTDAISSTDFFSSSALSLQSTNQEPHESSEIRSQRGRAQDTSAVANLKNQIRETQQQWLRHQDERFAAQLSRNQDELPLSRLQSSVQLPLTSASNILVLEQLNEIEKLIRSAGESLNSVLPASSRDAVGNSPLLTSRTCYTMALEQLTRTLQVLQDMDTTS